MSNIANQVDDPNDRYDGYTSNNLGIWSNISTVDNFFNNYNRNNAYNNGTNKLSLKDTVTIQDGTYNYTWKIVGFDKEKKQTSIDGTIYDNGSGILLLSTYSIETSFYKYGSSGYYYDSQLRSTISSICNSLKNVLGNHLVYRNVLLRNGESGYIWTKDYGTAPSYFQIRKSVSDNKYNIGESNYILPYVIKANDPYSKTDGWTRSNNSSNYIYMPDGRSYYYNSSDMYSIILIYVR